MATVGGLRELKKARTRDAIVGAGLELFYERGYDATTVADVAEAAEIAPRTFFGYFASKEDLVFHDFEELFVAFVARMQAREADEDAFAAMRAWILAYHGADGAARHRDDARRRVLVRETPALAAHERANAARFAEALSSAIADDLGADADGLRPRLAAAAAVAALEAVGRWADGEPRHHDLTEAMVLLDEAIVFLRGGLDALRAR